MRMFLRKFSAQSMKVKSLERDTKQKNFNNIMKELSITIDGNTFDVQSKVKYFRNGNSIESRKKLIQSAQNALREKMLNIDRV